METLWRSGSVAPPFLTLVLNGGEWSSYSHHFNHGKIDNTHGVRAWVGSTAGLDIMKERKFLPLPEIKPWLSPGYSLVAILTELSQLAKKNK
jgi:hypothetical protein